MRLDLDASSDDEHTPPPPPTIRELAFDIFSRTYSYELLAGTHEWLESLVEHFELADELNVRETFTHLAVGCKADDATVISVELLERIYEKLMVSADQPTEGTNGTEYDSSQYLKIVNAFDMPPWRWNEENKTFEKAANGASLAPPAASKARYLRDRFNIIKQVVLRNEHFSPPAVVGNERTGFMKLTTIKNLLGRQGGHFLIFGLLARMEDGAFYLEDLDDKVELDLSEANPESGLFTEGSLVLVSGDYTFDSTFKVNELGHPPSEKRSVSMPIHGRLDMLGIGGMADQKDLIRAERSPEHNTSFIILSDLHLDNFKILNALRSVLEVYEGLETAERPSLFILCGNFRSRPFLFDGEATREYTELFTTLANLLLSFPALLAHSRFLLIPGPTDPWSSLTLPRPALPASMVKTLTDKIPNITFGSNPCRIRYFSQDIVVFREDLMGRMMRNAVRLDGQKGTDLRKALVQTILDQAHLSPLPLNIRPVLWDYDHALRLYPMPTTLILADKFDPYKLVYEDCLVFNPGSFSRRKFAWSTYYPQMLEPRDRMEESELPGLDD